MYIYIALCIHTHWHTHIEPSRRLLSADPPLQTKQCQPPPNPPSLIRLTLLSHHQSQHIAAQASLSCRAVCFQEASNREMKSLRRPSCRSARLALHLSVEQSGICTGTHGPAAKNCADKMYRAQVDLTVDASVELQAICACQARFGRGGGRHFCPLVTFETALRIRSLISRPSLAALSEVRTPNPHPRNLYEVLPCS